MPCLPPARLAHRGGRRPAQAGPRPGDQRAAAAAPPRPRPRSASRARSSGLLGHTGLLGLPYAEEYGGGGQPYEVYLQVLEEVAAVWASVGVGRQRARALLLRAGHRRHRGAARRWLPDMLGGELLGAYCLSEAHAGSDPAAMRTTARRDGDDYVHQRRQGLDHPRRARRLLQGDGAHQRRPQRHLLLPRARGRRRAQRRPARAQDGPDRLGHRHHALRRRPGAGRAAARRGGRRAADRPRRPRRGRLGIAAVATGLAQGALDHAVAYARERETFGQPIIEHQGLAFVLADMEAAVAVGPGDDAARRAAQGPRAARSPARPRSPSWWPPTTP